MTVNTKKTEGYRKLRFDSIDALLEELAAIESASRANHLKVTGNWTPGQILSHLAAWVEYGYVGFPMKPAPFFIRFLLRLRLQKMLEQGMPRGIRIPGVRAGTTGQDDMPFDHAMSRLREALTRLKNGEPCTHDSPAFGALSHEDRIRLNLRHAELHLGYLERP